MHSRSLFGRLAVLLSVVLLIAVSMTMAVLSYSFTKQFVSEVTVESQPHATPHQIAERLREANLDTSRDRAKVEALISSQLSERQRFAILGDDLSILMTNDPEFRDAKGEFVSNDQLRLSSSVSEFGGPRLFSIVTNSFSPIASDAVGNTTAYLVIFPSGEPIDAGTSFAAQAWANVGIWLAIVIIVAVAAAWWILRKSLKPIDRLTAASRALRDGRIPAPVPVPEMIEVRALFEAFNEAVETMGRTDRLRQQMIADVAHELRTPVTNLKVQVEAYDSGLIESPEDLVARLKTETNLLTRLFEDFQQLFLSEAGQLQVSRDPIDLHEIVRDVVGTAAAAYDFEARIDLAKPLWVEGDADRIQQILTNLIENALRHRSSGLIIDVFAAESTSTKAVIVAFADNGPGIETGTEGRVFERFYRGKISREQAAEGAGLGLTIAKSLMNAMGGDIDLNTNVANGAEFHLTFVSAAHPADR